MTEEGLDVGENTLAFNRLLSINQQAISSRQALTDFWKLYSNQVEILTSGLSTLKTPIPSDLPIDLVPGALECLDYVGNFCDLALVTMGDFNFQIAKMEKAGIQPARFSKLIVGKGSSKKSDYHRILEEFQSLPSDGIVCGDRVSIDLSPAKELGLFTVHFKNGRGKVHSKPVEDIDLSIKTLKELHEVIVNKI